MDSGEKRRYATRMRVRRYRAVHKAIKGMYNLEVYRLSMKNLTCFRGYRKMNVASFSLFSVKL